MHSLFTVGVLTVEDTVVLDPLSSDCNRNRALRRVFAWSFAQRFHKPAGLRVAVRWCRVNQMKTRLQSLGLLGRAFKCASDEELEAMVEGLDEEHREAIEPLGITDAASIREAVNTGRLDGTMESLAVVLSDTCLADCIEQLGEHSDHPSTDQIREVLPDLIERHGLAKTRLMLASTVAGEANASAIIRDLLKHDETVKLPAAESTPVVIPERSRRQDADEEREAIVARRKEQRKFKQAEARTRRQQAEQARSKR